MPSRFNAHFFINQECQKKGKRKESQTKRKPNAKSPILGTLPKVVEQKLSVAFFWPPSNRGVAWVISTGLPTQKPAHNIRIEALFCTKGFYLGLGSSFFIQFIGSKNLKYTGDADCLLSWLRIIIKSSKYASPTCQP